jgi:hypothetical protein
MKRTTRRTRWRQWRRRTRKRARKRELALLVISRQSQMVRPAGKGAL